MASQSLPGRETQLDSDEFFQHICDLCSEDDQRVEATAFCTVCMQYLCGPCHKSHARINATKQHKLLTGKDMPEKEVDMKVKPKCKQHLDKILEYFCQDHKIACCSTCQRLNHRNCKKLIRFADLDKRRNFKYECKQKLTNMHYLLDEFKRLETVNVVKISDADLQKDDLIKMVRKKRKRIDQHLDNLEADMVVKIRKGIEHGVTGLDKSGDIHCILEELTTQIKEFEDILTTTSSDQEIVMTVLMEAEIRKYATIINELNANSFQLETKLTLSKEVKSFSNHIQSFGDIDIIKNSSDFLRPFENREALYLWDIDISSPSDKALPEVQTLEILQNGGLLICEANNNKIKLFDSNFEFQNEVLLTAQPQSMVMLNSTDAMISFLDENSLQDLNITDSCSLNLGQKYKTHLNVSELARYKDEMVVLADDASFWYLYTVNRKGYFGQCIRKEPASGGLFESPIMIRLSTDQKILYVVDVTNGCFGISLNGDVVFQYRDAAMKTYVGVCTIADNLTCLSGPESDKMVLINNAGEKVKDIAAVKGLETLTYSKTSNKLFAENSLTKSVSVFALI